MSEPEKHHDADEHEHHSARSSRHVDLYDRVKVIPFDKLTSFFTQHLK